MGNIRLNLEKFKQHLLDKLHKTELFISIGNPHFLNSLSSNEKTTLFSSLDNLVIEFKIGMKKETDLSVEVTENHLANIASIKENVYDISLEETINLSFNLYKKDLQKNFFRSSPAGQEDIDKQLTDIKKMEEKLHKLVKIEPKINKKFDINSMLTIRQKFNEKQQENKIKY